MNTYDENNLNLDDELDNTNEFEGYSVVDAEDVNADRTIETSSKVAAKKEENYDDGQTAEASPLKTDIQSVIIDKPKVAGLTKGDVLTLDIKSAKSISVLSGDKKIGELKPAYIAKLLDIRKNQYAQCFFLESHPLAMIELRFSTRPKKGAVKIEVV